MSILKPLIGVINLSKKISNDDIKLAVMASQLQIKEDVAPNWHMDPCFVIFYPDPKLISPRAFPVVIFDSMTDPNAIWYHAERNGKNYACIFVDPILAAGGVIINDPIKPQNSSISAALSHEIIESFLDTNTNKWVDGPIINSGSSYALDIAGPVQENTYTKTIANKLVSVSNFILPSWFDKFNPENTPVDYMNILQSPFTMSPGGTLLVRSAPGTETEVFLNVKPFIWRQETNAHIASRTARRLSNNVMVKKPWWSYLL